MEYLPVEFPHFGETLGSISHKPTDPTGPIMPKYNQQNLMILCRQEMSKALPGWISGIPGGKTEEIETGGYRIPRVSAEFWSARQRKGSPLHEISYRACFKPQLPRYFISALTRPGDTVYDPFSGRGTTVLEAGLLGRKIIANDANPLSRILTKPRFFPPVLSEIEERLSTIEFSSSEHLDIDLSMFYHPDTEAEIASLRSYLKTRRNRGAEDDTDTWIRMVATNRLTGHSPGFFSVYTLPPNQAVSTGRQAAINLRRNQAPEYRDVRYLILKKTKSLLRGLSKNERENLEGAGKSGLFLIGDARQTPRIPDRSTVLTVTSPPFLDTVQYAKDNWLRCWFNGIDADEVEQRLTVTRSLNEWCSVMASTMKELHRITVPGGHVAFEVGEVRRGSLRLDEHIVPLGGDAGFIPLYIILNQQLFTKTSHIWGVGNNDGGTNTNRIVVFRKKE
jgi:hypothetical protein